jgi:aspartate racemase
MHRRIGILGGMSPESTAEYYQYITRTYVERYGDHNYPEIIIYSVRFQPYIDWPAQERWDLAIAGLQDAARRLEAAGADFILIATNTFHYVIDEVQAGVNAPLLSLLDAVGVEIRARGMRRVGLLGTRFTMEKPFYSEALGRQGIDVLTPETAARAFVNDVIYRELVAGVLREESRAGFVEIIRNLTAQGAEGIILGCTEIPLLVREGDVAVPLFDTLTIHAEAALAYALQRQG